MGADLLLEAEERRLRPLFDGCRRIYLELARYGLDRLANLNTRKEHEQHRGRNGRARQPVTPAGRPPPRAGRR